MKKIIYRVKATGKISHDSDYDEYFRRCIKMSEKELLETITEFNRNHENIFAEIVELDDIAEFYAKRAELADALIKAGVGAVEEIKKEAEYWKNEATTARADIDDAVEEITKRIFSELRDYFVEQSAYAADCNQHTGYRDYEIKASDVVCDIVAIAEKYGVELGAKDDD